ncbi:MAG: type II secretion system F family protein [Actinobacteria bacterium]|nr:type II secretion system F family protein [Actinomycetota bacterium]
MRRFPIKTKLARLSHFRAQADEDGGFLKRLLPGSYLTRLEDKFKVLGGLKIAGFRVSDPIMFVTLRIFTTLMVLIITLMISTFTGNWLAIIFSLIAWFLPGYLLESSLRMRKERISADIPDFVSAVNVCLSSGINLDEALLEISQKYDGEIYSLLKKAMVDVEMGRNKRDALRDFASRGGVDELKMLIKSIIFAQNSGADINNVMESVSENVIERRRLKSYVRGQKSPILVIAMIIVFIVPPTLILMFMPVLLNLRNL